MSTVNQRAARRWDKERDRRMMTAWDEIIKRRYPPQSQTWMKQVGDILAPLYDKDGWQERSHG